MVNLEMIIWELLEKNFIQIEKNLEEMNKIIDRK